MNESEARIFLGVLIFAFVVGLVPIFVERKWNCDRATGECRHVYKLKLQPIDAERIFVFFILFVISAAFAVVCKMIYDLIILANLRGLF